jgi:hypothetical protein
VYSHGRTLDPERTADVFVTLWSSLLGNLKTCLAAMGHATFCWPEPESRVISALRHLVQLCQSVDAAQVQELDAGLELFWQAGAALKSAVDAVPARPLLEALEHWITADEWAAPDGTSVHRAKAKIPVKYRTKPMSLKTAARLMGYGEGKDAVERLRATIEVGAVACETLTRKQHVFDRRDFPKESQSKLGADLP